MAIELKNAYVKYNNLDILRDLNVCINSGSTTGIIGKSGCGKTTFLELLSGFTKTYEGDLNILNYTKLDNKNISSFRKDVFLLPQNSHNFFFESSCYKELELSLKYFKYNDNQIRIKIEEAIKKASFDESLLDLHPSNLSDGEKRKLMLAILLTLEPKIILFDEPTVGLDSKSKNNLINLIKKMNKDGKTILVVSHDIDFIDSVVDNLIVINNKTIMYFGSKEDAYKRDDIFNDNLLKLPRLVSFNKKVSNMKDVELTSNNINDLIKEVYRNVSKNNLW